MTYPPEPWSLCGRLSVSLWRLPKRELPAVGQGLTPVLAGGAGIVGTAWVVYGPGSVLEYNELLVAVLVRRKARLRACITRIWVDSEASRQGGRALWGIPKESAGFDISTTTPWQARARGIASATLHERATLPGTWPLRYHIAQPVAAGIRESKVRVRTRIALSTASWTPERHGPLGWLHGHRPFASVTMHDFEMRFGGNSTTVAHS
ncbi:acetoacetate decarboxylase [Halopolyspora algeriensis]|uniref:Acetoacetate decarboxylase n=1 Tax=Halopolyspora algeriensis TaxID=1500506 RepID=A0A368VU79_9ACTN|nr:acetoacetate decarboxylase family protein [Halopolyspora algeriensis]RCW44633.1 acetoacetate decarboxylase [Halopolyspora algeriensis]TQM55994.1 acetoacetate decarboxylase [Halopolyspora algeriensis]